MASPFFGEYEHNIDDKGRLTIPSKFRDSLGQSFMLTKGIDCCLFVFPMESWNAFEAKLKALPISDKDARDFTRFFFAGASECSLDRQGRISIPANLRRYAKLNKETRIIGVSDRLEIWSSDNWEAYNNLDAGAIADKMAELGI